MKKLLPLLFLITAGSSASGVDLFEPKSAGIGFLVGSASAASCYGVYYWAQQSAVDRSNINSISALTHIVSPFLATIAAVYLAGNDKKAKNEARNIAVCIDLLGGLLLPRKLDWYYIVLCKILGASIGVYNTEPENNTGLNTGDEA